MKKLILATLILCLPGMGSYAQTATSGESYSQIKENISMMRDKWRANFVPDGKLDSSLLQVYIENLDKDSVFLWEKLNRDTSIENMLWQDTVLNKSTSAGKLKLGVQLYTVYQRLFTLTKAYKTPGSKLYANPQVKKFLTNALKYLNQEYYHESTPEYGNWWHWELGISRVVNNILVMLYDELDQSLINDYNLATAFFVKRPTHLAESSGAPYSSLKNAVVSTGGNRSDAATVVFVRGLLQNDPKEIKAAVDSLPVVLDTVKSGDGFYQDFSFIQHKDLPYTGTYGQVLLKGLGLIKNSIAGTSLDFSPQDNEKLYDVIMNSFVPWLYEGKMLDAVNGRSISRKNEQNKDVGIGVINSIVLFLEGAPEKDKQELINVLRSQLTPDMMAYYKAKLPDSMLAYQIVNEIAYQDKVDINNTARGYLYSDMDRLLYKGDGFVSVVAMHSKRVGSYECINGENLKGQRTADGMTYIYLAGNEDYYNYWPVVDSNYMPGTTSSGKIGSCDEEYRTDRLGHANIAWAGGVVLDQYASASIHLHVSEHSLKAKKSWFFTPHQVVMLGQGIESPESTVTTIDNRKIDNSDIVRVDGNLIQADSETRGVNVDLTVGDNQIIYRNLYQKKVTVIRENRSADWSEIGTSAGKITGQFLKILQKHDKSDNKYAWIVYPNAINKNQEQPEILANTTKVQAIKLAGSQVIYANFWRSSEIEGIKGITPLSVILIPVINGYQVAVSSPARDSRISFQLNGNVKLSRDPEHRVSVNNNIVSIDVSGLRGSSYVFELNNQ